jgi:dihydroneopterin aldolase
VNDIVSIRDLQVSAVIGVLDWEREVEQVLTFCVEMSADVRSAAKSDDINDTLDYSKVADTVRLVVMEGKFRLIETAAERVAERLIHLFDPGWLKIQVAKPIADEGYTAAIVIERGQRRARLL